MAGPARRVARKGDTDVVALDVVPGVPSIGVLRLEPGVTVALPGPHAHDFLALAFFELDGGSLATRRTEWQLHAGDLLITGPGEAYDARGLSTATGWVVFFAPDAPGSQAGGGVLAWASHPLLFPFAARATVEPRRLRVPDDRRGWWSAHLDELDRELRERRDGYAEAAAAELTLLLIATARIASSALATDLRGNGEPLLAHVFEAIERQYAGHASLRSVAEDVALTPGHLTTVVRRKTGRTVQGWIVERRMVEARRLLAETDLSIEEVGDRVGLPDPRYFIRTFKRVHEMTPNRWRRAALGR